MIFGEVTRAACLKMHGIDIEPIGPRVHGGASNASLKTAMSLDDVCDSCHGLAANVVDSVLQTHGVSRADYESHLPTWRAGRSARAAAWLSAMPMNAETLAMQEKHFPKPAIAAAD